MPAAERARGDIAHAIVLSRRKEASRPQKLGHRTRRVVVEPPDLEVRPRCQLEQPVSECRGSADGAQAASAQDPAREPDAGQPAVPGGVQSQHARTAIRQRAWPESRPGSTT
jgi:hypothetical protein